MADSQGCQRTAAHQGHAVRQCRQEGLPPCTSTQYSFEYTKGSRVTYAESKRLDTGTGTTTMAQARPGARGARARGGRADDLNYQ